MSSESSTMGRRYPGPGRPPSDASANRSGANRCELRRHVGRSRDVPGDSSFASREEEKGSGGNRLRSLICVFSARLCGCSLSASDDIEPTEAAQGSGTIGAVNLVIDRA
jgi:hypothetical protein